MRYPEEISDIHNSTLLKKDFTLAVPDSLSRFFFLPVLDLLGQVESKIVGASAIDVLNPILLAVHVFTENKFVTFFSPLYLRFSASEPVDPAGVYRN
ncbi:hypothetical protein GWI33_020519 [Rhynchophorus ferrugineus]|uniref:Uncharacterized protein n=1 Tax=Rhynchophorus ferrugineus TaxID=354439 RepID=A0A834HS97_RHYFE|nr:hypothetical protein GWI33_020519 [Rhynchophorus ferrugineus]